MSFGICLLKPYLFFAIDIFQRANDLGLLAYKSIIKYGRRASTVDVAIELKLGVCNRSMMTLSAVRIPGPHETVADR